MKKQKKKENTLDDGLVCYQTFFAQLSLCFMVHACIDNIFLYICMMIAQSSAKNVLWKGLFYPPHTQMFIYTRSKITFVVYYKILSI